MKRIAALFGALMVAGSAAGQESKTLDQLMKGWGTDLDNVRLSTVVLKPGLHAVLAAGGTAILSVGEQGVLLVDDKFPQVQPQLKDAIRALGGDGVDFVINTHWHFDHADGNPVLGANGAWIVAHANSRDKMMSGANVAYVGYSYDQPPYPPEGLPVITFDDRMRIHFNGESIELRYFGPAHTTGDAIVHFLDSNVAHVGDLYSAGYPYIDAGNGGSLTGLIAACHSILDIIDEDTVIVSGHAPVSGYADFVAYLSMLEQVQSGLEDLVGSGQPLDAVLGAGLTAEHDAARGDPTLFLTMAYLAQAQ